MTSHVLSNRAAMALITACLVALGIGVGLAALMQARIPILDPVTACALGRATSGSTVVVIDRTDPDTPPQAAALRERLRQLEEELEPNELVSVWVISDLPEGSLRRVFCRCFPGRQANALLQSRRRVAKRCDSLFSQPLHDLAAGLPGPERAPRSPILEALCTLGRAELGGTAGPRRLLVVSDLWQNSRPVSFYPRIPTFTAFRSSPGSDRLIPDLRGVDVELLRTPRAGEDLGVELQLLRFWEACLKAAGARSVRIRRLT
jgi:hypothetical protein